MNVLKVNYEADNAKALFSESLKNTGFAVLNNHPIDPQLVKKVYDEWVSFFARDDKSEYQFNVETQDGFFPMSVSEVAKGYKIRDIKEFYQYYPWGQFPPFLSDSTKALYDKLNTLARELLVWLEENLPLEAQNALSMPLSEMIDKSPQTMLRILHYPPLKGTEEKDAIRAAAHEDINLITLLVGATTKGLQVQDTNGNWLDVPHDDNSIVINVGDMLSLATKGFYKATTHRVVNPDNTLNISRLSLPLFLHPRRDVYLTENRTAGEFLDERLIEIGTKY